MMTAEVSVTPFDRLLPRGAASVYDTLMPVRPPVLTVHRLGVGYVPQGRRVWPNLSVDEHLRLAAGYRRDASWTVERPPRTD